MIPGLEVWEILNEGERLSEAEVLQLEEFCQGRVLVDATEQTIYRWQDNQIRKEHYCGKKKAFTLKTEMVSDSEHHIIAISSAVPGAMHDKKRKPTGAHARATARWLPGARGQRLPGSGQGGDASDREQ